MKSTTFEQTMKKTFCPFVISPFMRADFGLVLDIFDHLLSKYLHIYKTDGPAVCDKLKMFWECPEKVPGKSLESSEKVMRNPWERPWWILEKLWEVLRKSWESLRESWESSKKNQRKVYKSLRKSSESPKKLPPILAYSYLFKSNPVSSSLFLLNPAYSSLFQAIPAYSSLFWPIPAFFFDLFQPIPAYSNLFKYIQAHPSLFKPIQVHSSLLQSIPACVSVFWPCVTFLKRTFPLKNVLQGYL